TASTHPPPLTTRQNMNATKRKFNAIIQGIGNKPSPPPSITSNDDGPPTPRGSIRSVASTPSKMGADADLLSKRRRLGIPGSTPDSKGSTSISNVVLRKWSLTRKQPEPQPQPKYCPSDRGELLKRLATFQELVNWAPKPDRVNEVEWAKRGWTCRGKERVRCVLCNKELVVGLNKKEVDGKEVPVLVPSEIEEKLVDKYAELIVESHQEDCLWKKRGCEDSLLRISFSNATANLESLRSRYDELCARKPFLPYEFNLKLPEEVNIDTILSQLPTDFFSNPASANDTSDPTSPNRTALVLALMGWQGLSDSRIGAVPNSASCHTCLRRLGLWMFKSKEVGPNNEIIVPAPMDHLDPVKEHRFFCPWKNAHTQRLGSSRSTPESDLPAWKMLAQSLRNEAYLRGVLDDSNRAGSKSANRRAVEVTVQDVPSTPTKMPATPTTGGIDSPFSAVGAEDGEDDTARDAKDKERWARLRRVKSLFDSKGSRKLKRANSRPGTAVSTKSAKSGSTKDQ
ncbi:hypothetical protein jhhlp_003227, partial [Lomentospora prolificans]